MPQRHLVVPDCVQANITFSLGPRIVACVQHFRIPTGVPVTPALVDSVFTPLTAHWSATMAPFCGPAVALALMTMRDLRVDGMPLVQSTAGGVPGTDTADRLPNQIAIVLTLRTARAGRRYRGRNYWPGLSESASAAGGTLTAPAHTGIANFAAGYLTAVNRGGLQLTVMHRPIFGEDGSITVPGTQENVTSVVLRNDVLDTQRRRQTQA